MIHSRRRTRGGAGRRPLRARALGGAALLLGLSLALSLATLSTGPRGHTGAPLHGVLTGWGESSADGNATTLDTRAAPLMAAANGTFAISGSVGGLFPGATRSLILTASNPFSFPIVVTSMTVSVGQANASCPGTDLTVTGFSGSLAVPRNSKSQATVSVTMVKATPNACQGATFPLTYRGTATKG